MIGDLLAIGLLMHSKKGMKGCKKVFHKKGLSKKDWATR